MTEKDKMHQSHQQLHEAYQVLDLGAIEVVNHSGSDLMVVNAARVSFDTSKSKFDDKDEKLLNYLAKHQHFSPFRMIDVTLRIKAPRVIARQWWKHVVGGPYVFNDLPWNEVSGRYIEFNTELHHPEVWRNQAKNNKQASEGAIDEQNKATYYYELAITRALQTYSQLLALGVCREQARLILPESVFTSWIWKPSLQAVSHFVNLRDDDHAQWEIREYAKALDGIMANLYPKSWAALMENK